MNAGRAFPIGVYFLSAMTLGTVMSRLMAHTYTSGYMSVMMALPDSTALTVSCHDQMLNGSIRNGW